MEDILRKLMSNDSESVREGTVQLKEEVNNPESIGILCKLLSLHQDADIRQFAAVILKKRFSKKNKWTTVDPQLKAEIKAGLLQTFINEPEKNVKNCIAYLIGVILKHDYPEWQELMSFLQQAMTSENTNDRELGYYMLSILTETCPDEMQAHAPSFCTHFSTALSNMTDKASPVGYFMMICLTHMCPSLSSSKQLMNIYNEIIPKTYEVIQALAEKRPDRACEALDLYYELTSEKDSLSLITSRIKAIINLCLDLTQKSKSEDLQIKALNFIATFSMVKAKLLFKDGLMNTILSVLFAIMKAPPLDDEDEQYFSADTSEDTLLTCACETLDVIAINADPKKVMVPVMEMVRPALQSAVPYDRKGAYLVMAIVCQGCDNYVRNNMLEDFVSTVYKGVNDPSSVVRNAALFAMGQMAEHLQPEICKHATDILPLLINQLDRLGEEGKNGARMGQRVDRLFYAIESFSEILETSLTGFLNELIPRLLVLSVPPYHPHVRELAMANIGTAAGSVEEAIAPYFRDIMNVLNVYLSSPSDSDSTSLKVEAIDTLSMLARHVGPNEFQPLALDSIKLGIQLVAETDDPDIRKSTYGLFGSVSHVLKGEMGPLLESIVLPIINTIKDQQAYVVHKRDDAMAAFPLYDSDSEDKNEDFDDISIENDYVEEKEEACFALKKIAENTGVSFAPFLESSMEEVYKLLNFPSLDVRKAALEAEAQFCISFTNIMLNASHGDNNLVITIMEKIIGKTIELIKKDLEREVVLVGLECLQTLLKEIGPQIGSIEHIKKAIIDVLKDVLNSKTESHLMVGAGDDEATESEVMDAACDVVPLLSKAMSQPEFSQLFAEFLPLLRNRIIQNQNEVESDEDDEDEMEGTRANTIGVIAECMSGLGENVSGYVNSLLPYLLGLTKDPDANVRNNSLYTIGEMALHGKQHVYQHYPTILNALSQVLASESKPKVLDNACGVLARLILTNAQGIPLQQVFRAFVAQLPLKEDFSEDVWVMKAICHVIQNAPDVARSEVYLILQAAGFTLQSHAPDDECKEVLLNTFRALFAQLPQECQLNLPQLPPKLIETLREIGVVSN